MHWNLYWMSLCHLSRLSCSQSKRVRFPFLGMLLFLFPYHCFLQTFSLHQSSLLHHQDNEHNLPLHSDQEACSDDSGVSIHCFLGGFVSDRAGSYRPIQGRWTQPPQFQLFSVKHLLQARLPGKHLLRGIYIRRYKNIQSTRAISVLLGLIYNHNTDHNACHNLSDLDKCPGILLGEDG